MNEEVLRRQLVAQPVGGQAYSPIEEAIRAFPFERASRSCGRSFLSRITTLTTWAR